MAEPGLAIAATNHARPSPSARAGSAPVPPRDAAGAAGPPDAARARVAGPEGRRAGGTRPLGPPCRSLCRPAPAARAAEGACRGGEIHQTHFALLEPGRAYQDLRC